MFKNYYQKLKKNCFFLLQNILYLGKKNLFYFLFLLIFILGLFLQNVKWELYFDPKWFKFNDNFFLGIVKINEESFVIAFLLFCFFLTFLFIFFVKKRKLHLKIAFLMIFLGTLDNFYQRFFTQNNGVYDYFWFPNFFFNIEDLMIFFGTLIIVIHFFKFFLHKKRKKLNSKLQVKIIYLDDTIIVIEKPYGIVSHPDFHHKDQNVCTILKKYLNFPKNKINPGIIQRLDKQATGIMVVARNQEGERDLKLKMKKRQIIRKYFALCEGEIKQNKFIVDVPLKKPGKIKKAQVSVLGKKAISHFKIIKKNLKHTLVECELKTGRTHQLRAHLKYINHPIVNDNLYQNKKGKNDYIFLHAFYLKFVHPKSQKIMEFKIKKPLYFDKLLQEK